MRGRLSWDAWYTLLADFIGQRSKDPSTQCGAVIVRPDNTIAATGYNGFPRAIEDRPELLNDRTEKYKRVVHAEMNAILTAREPLHGYTLYTTPICPCERCAAHVIQAGITKVVFPHMNPHLAEKYVGRIDFGTSMQLFHEAGVQLVEIDAGLGVVPS